MSSSSNIFFACKGKIALAYSTRGFMLIGVLTLSVFIMFCLSVMSGNYSISFSEVMDVLMGTSKSDSHSTVIWSFRMPRACASALVGFMLALSGATLQNLTRNPLADPSLIGISQGAALAVVSLIIFLPEYESYKSIAGFLGAIFVAFIIHVMSSHNNTSNTLRFILVGVGISAFIASATVALLTYGNVHRAMTAMSWQAGGLHASNWHDVMVLSTAAVFLFPILFLTSRVMRVMDFGDEVCIGLGIDIRFTKIVLITLSVALAGITVSVTGPIGFVGLLAPHIAKKITQSINCTGVMVHLITSALVGALLMMLADLLGRCAFGSTQVQAGLLTPIIGVPFLVALMVKHRS